MPQDEAEEEKVRKEAKRKGEGEKGNKKGKIKVRKEGVKRRKRSWTRINRKEEEGEEWL